MSKITVETYIPGKGLSSAAEMLDQILQGENPHLNYSRMMSYRLSGAAAAECMDIYFIAEAEGQAVSRLWYGWGRHADAIGNFGNFKTVEAWRGKGVGGLLLAAWNQNRLESKDLPLALFCSAGTPELVQLYGKYGFRLAVRERKTGPLYCPLGNSPATFLEFCEKYYTPSKQLFCRPASVGWRHEIDCLLNFALTDLGLAFGLPGILNLEDALLHPEKGKAELFFMENGHCVGWAFTPANGCRSVQLHPNFIDSSVNSLA